MVIELCAPGKHFDGWRLEFGWERACPVVEIPTDMALQISLAIELGARYDEIPERLLLAARLRFELTDRRTHDGLPIYDLAE